MKSQEISTRGLILMLNVKDEKKSEMDYLE